MVKTQILLAAEGGHNPIIPEPVEIVVGLVAFLLLLFVLWKYAVPRFEKVYEERSKRIEGGIEKAEAAQAEAQRTLEQYRSQLAEARAEAARIRDDARAEGQQIVEEMRAQAQAESERIVSAGQSALAAQRAQIVAELRADLGRQAVDLAGRVVGESLEDEARRRGTVDRFLDELEAASAPASKA
ncbi:ATP synthase F0 subcomplex B subunit [Saccharopolyspora erythraea NRRL 2338]|uniref:ATP synthase subunit b n=1 Tax=Saccharopolyspora erythraea TaxID=1836 RepID=A0ABP3NPJ4_SACER|nr:F0F1 ATP synthase subunit B [Saccharopolyspora erythraea]EQD81720.1 F0F1 ATP synthase subunit B [Saccharopolyspora erythraea D]PFG99097.1 ATP synthase F0 subcomplex B subunit [Saccharopolyspora erythraea NRRL 2338]